MTQSGIPEVKRFVIRSEFDDIKMKAISATVKIIVRILLTRVLFLNLMVIRFIIEANIEPTSCEKVGSKNSATMPYSTAGTVTGLNIK